MLESECPANVCRRNTMNQPVMPAITATIVPASSALTMNGNEKSPETSLARFHERPGNDGASTMPVAVHERCFRRADDDQSSVGRSQNLDRRAVQASERLGRDHRLGRALDSTA